MLASLDRQRNRRGMIQAFVSDGTAVISPSMAFFKQTRRRLRLHTELAL